MEAYLAIAGLVTVAAVTPGPNNFIVMEAAARGGVAAALPAIFGVMLGTLILLSLVWAGTGALFDTHPGLRGLLTAAGCLYLVWLGAALVWRSSDGGEVKVERTSLPRSLTGLALFQLFNPKGWVMVLTAMAAASSSGVNGTLLLAQLVAIFLLVTGLCLLLWALAGTAIAHLLRQPGGRRWFDRAMGILLIASAVPLAI